MAQSFEVSGHTGAGGVKGEDISGGGIGAFGASFKPGLPLCIDCQYLIPTGEGANGLHLFTAGWFKQAKTGRSRPFFQVSGRSRTPAIRTTRTPTPITASRSVREPASRCRAGSSCGRKFG